MLAGAPGDGGEVLLCCRVKEELKMSFFLLLGRVAVTTSSGGLKGPVNKLNFSDFFFLINNTSKREMNITSNFSD